MKVRKAVITAAGESQRHLPLQTVVDGRGRSRKVLGLLVDEVASAGVEEVGIVIRPGFEELYRDVADDVTANLTFITQPEQRGYADAVLCARGWISDEPFLLMVSDHLYVSDARDKTCAQQLMAIAEQEDCAVSGVQPTHESKLPYFGAIGGSLFDRERELYEVNAVLEKPTPTEAEQLLVTPGLRHGHYLSFLGMHVLNALFMDTLHERGQRSNGAERHLSGALDEVAKRGRYLALAIDGRRYDLDRRHGLLVAQLAVGLSGDHREEVLKSIVEVLAQASVAQSANTR